MAKRSAPRPSDGELAILRVLWQRGPCTVRGVHEALNPAQPTGYTTTLKLMQIMLDKGLVTRDESDRAHVYRAALSRKRTLRRLAADLVDRAFGGSAEELVVHALEGRKVTPDELERIRKLLDELGEDR